MHFLVHIMYKVLHKKDIQRARLVVLFSTRRSGVGDFAAAAGGAVNVRAPMFVRQRHAAFTNVRHTSVSLGRDGEKRFGWLQRFLNSYASQPSPPPHLWDPEVLRSSHSERSFSAVGESWPKTCKNVR